MWRGEPITFHVDHIDGNSHDSRPENVRFLCPNCHSQTPTWAGRNVQARIAHERLR
ncbi:HNH endonuclease signature motif containing protein [Rhodococcus pyridinivorans]|uniref:HNH endonuclease signature motif containing protein n=2 Tax=Rhodococcus TaxID=1827 RepID=UPI0027D83C93|nr:HNH endonuclease signature motif containing protein [Rhodococcus pyridinivorans]